MYALCFGDALLHSEARTMWMWMITILTESMPPKGLLHLQITLPIPMHSMSTRRGLGMKARSIAVV